VPGGRLVVDCSNTTGRMRHSDFPHDRGHDLLPRSSRLSACRETSPHCSPGYRRDRTARSLPGTGDGSHNHQGGLGPHALATHSGRRVDPAAAAARGRTPQPAASRRRHDGVRRAPEPIRSGRGGAGRGWGGAGGRRGARPSPVGKEGLHDGRVLHNCDDLQPAATAGTGEDIEGEHAVHQRRPGPRTPGSGVGRGRGGVGLRATVAHDRRAPASTLGQNAGQRASPTFSVEANVPWAAKTSSPRRGSGRGCAPRRRGAIALPVDPLQFAFHELIR
jgi:hypothetical protein